VAVRWTAPERQLFGCSLETLRSRPEVCRLFIGWSVRDEKPLQYPWAGLMTSALRNRIVCGESSTGTIGACANSDQHQVCANDDNDGTDRQRLRDKHRNDSRLQTLFVTVTALVQQHPC
jgi:hypothetical protein